MLEIDREILLKYSLDIKSFIPFRDGFIINTSKGKKVLKKSEFCADRIMFIHSVKEYLHENGFTNLDRYVCTHDGIPSLEIDGVNYTISDLTEGRECNFDSRDDIIKASQLLASLHKASKGYVPPGDCNPKDDLGNLPMYFQKRLDEIKKLKKIAKKGRSKFDYLFLDCYDYFYELGDDAIRSLNNSTYTKLVEEARNCGIICHHDFTHHNIVCGEDKVFLTNFDFCCLELKVYDIANLLRRKMRKCDWDIAQAGVILDKYSEIEHISKEEFVIMKIILQFPQKLWRVVNKYYNSKRGWSEKSYVLKLQEVVDEIKYHKPFIERLDELYR